jgi:hypothetical protein
MTRVHGKLTRLTLGEWPTVTLADAHTAATTAKRQAKAGVDPREAQRLRQSDADEARATHLRRMADQFIERYAKPKLRDPDHRGLQGRAEGQAHRKHGKTSRLPASPAAT